MSQALHSSMSDMGNDYTYSESYRTYIESHLTYLRELDESFEVVLDKGKVYKHLNDFASLFLDMGIRYEDHYTMLRLNGFTSNHELTLEVESLKMLPTQALTVLKQLYRTVSGRV